MFHACHGKEEEEEEVNPTEEMNEVHDDQNAKRKTSNAVVANLQRVAAVALRKSTHSSSKRMPSNKSSSPRRHPSMPTDSLMVKSRSDRSLGVNLTKASESCEPKTKNVLHFGFSSNISQVKSARKIDSPVKRNIRPAASLGSSNRTSPDGSGDVNRLSPFRDFSWDGSPVVVPQNNCISIERHSVRRLQTPIDASPNDHYAGVVAKREQFRRGRSATALLIEGPDVRGKEHGRKSHLMQKSASLCDIHTRQQTRKDGNSRAKARSNRASTCNHVNLQKKTAKAVKILSSEQDLHMSHHSAPVYLSSSEIVPTKKNRSQLKQLCYHEPQKTSRREQLQKTSSGLLRDKANKSCSQLDIGVRHNRRNSTPGMTQEGPHAKQTRRNSMTNAPSRSRPCGNMKRVHSNKELSHNEWGGELCESPVTTRKKLLSSGTLSTFFSNSSHDISMISPLVKKPVVVNKESSSPHSSTNGSTEKSKSIGSGEPSYSKSSGSKGLGCSKSDGSDNDDSRNDGMPKKSLGSYLSQFSSMAQDRLQKQIIINDATSITCPSEMELTEDTTIFQSVSTGLFSGRLLTSVRNHNKPGASATDQLITRENIYYTAPSTPNTFAVLDESTASITTRSDAQTFASMDGSFGLSSLLTGVSPKIGNNYTIKEKVDNSTTVTKRDPVASFLNGINPALLRLDDSTFSFEEFTAKAELLKQSLLQMSGHSQATTESTQLTSNLTDESSRQKAPDRLLRDTLSDESSSSSSDEASLKDQMSFFSTDNEATECSSIISGQSSISFPRVSSLLGKSAEEIENNPGTKRFQTSSKQTVLSIQEEESESENSFASYCETADSDLLSVAHTEQLPTPYAARNLVAHSALNISASNCIRSDAKRLSSSDHNPLQMMTNQRPSRCRGPPVREEQFSQSERSIASYCETADSDLLSLAQPPTVIEQLSTPDAARKLDATRLSRSDHNPLQMMTSLRPSRSRGPPAREERFSQLISSQHTEWPPPRTCPESVDRNHKTTKKDLSN